MAILTAAALTACGNENKNSAGTDGQAVPIRMPAAAETIVLGMGCFWGAEKRMAALPGVVDVVSGYAGGDYADPSYRKLFASEGRDGVRNHAEVVRVTFDLDDTPVHQILAGFWESHDPTQGDRQGNDVGSNYRSAIFYHNEAPQQHAQASKQALEQSGEYDEPITTEITQAGAFYKEGELK